MDRSCYFRTICLDEEDLSTVSIFFKRKEKGYNWDGRSNLFRPCYSILVDEIAD